MTLIMTKPRAQIPPSEIDSENLTEPAEFEPVPDVVPESPADLQFLKSAAEALIFASNEPLTQAQFSAALGNGNDVKLADVVVELNHDYLRQGRAFEILPVAGGFQYFTRRDFAGLVRRLFAERARTRLSRPALETLAVVAYRGPVTKAEIDEIRGVDCGGVLHTLLDRHLVAVRGRAKVVGRPLLYETTLEFLKHFGLSDLNDLPRDSELLREWGEARSIDEAAEPADLENSAQVDMPLPLDEPDTGSTDQPTDVGEADEEQRT
jgi:segregation and condensation protein B